MRAAPLLPKTSRHHGHAANVANYIDPFVDPGWAPSRTDMGVDWIALRPEPVLAIGNGVILGADWHAPWPGKRIIWYQLTDGPVGEAHGSLPGGTGRPGCRSHRPSGRGRARREALLGAGRGAAGVNEFRHPSAGGLEILRGAGFEDGL